MFIINSVELLVLQFLDQAADDPNVSSIYITQYRVAKGSEVISALVKAVRHGKKVMVFVELKARFDEESNIHSTVAGVKTVRQTNVNR